LCVDTSLVCVRGNKSFMCVNTSLLCVDTSLLCVLTHMLTPSQSVCLF